MLIRRWRRRLPGVFFWLCLGCAVVLVLLVLAYLLYKEFWKDVH